jgi:hypothetical protein
MNHGLGVSRFTRSTSPSSIIRELDMSLELYYKY